MWDFLVVGGGIAGASVAHALAASGSTLLLERESQPGYHATGRSAAVFAASYGPAPARALTRASQAFLLQPPACFAPHQLLTPRGALFVAEAHQEEALASLGDTLARETCAVRRLTTTEACARLPVLRADKVLGALWDPEVCDIDVHALHQGFLRALRQAGGQWRCDAEVKQLARQGDCWQAHVAAAGGAEVLQARIVINAAGAWCDQLAALAGLAPLGIVPKRRSAFVFAGLGDLSHAGWPMAIGVGEDWYLKPDAGQWLGSPANADPTTPQDVQAEELDIALGMHRIEEMTHLRIGRPSRHWAGLRSFFADGCPVAGFDPQAQGFFWLAGQGGYGIQTAPALGLAAAALVRGETLPCWLTEQGLSAQDLSVQRLRVRVTAS
ncbi:MAG: FAD-binding oxidoreductase [Rubrivivax sp.]|nr:FAD-binding oxidoreductase [Rubrivivax sp.]